MKELAFILMFCLTGSPMMAQTEISQTKGLGDVKQMMIECQWANIIVRTSETDQIKLEGVAMINKGENDEAFTFDWEQRGNTLTFRSDIENMDDLPKYITYKKNGQEYTRKLEPGEKAGWRNYRDHDDDGDLVEMTSGVLIDIDLIFYVPPSLQLNASLTYGDVSLEKVNNAMKVESTYGHVIATFTESGLQADCSITSTYSFVDVSIPQASKANLSLQTNYGEIYSNVDFQYDRSKSIDEMYKNRIAGTLNEGGVELKLKSPYNNVYLRKS